MSLLLNATASDVIITVKTVLNLVPTILSQGFGVNEVIQIDDVEDMDTDMTTDGTMIAWKRPRKIIGKITLQGNATGTKSLIDLIKVQKVVGAANPATLTVSSPSNLYTGTFSNVIFTTKFKGFEFGEYLQPVVFTFHASEVNETILGSVLGLASGVAGLL